MAGQKGIAGAEMLRKRTKAERGGNTPKLDGFDRSAPDSLGTWRDAYLESLRSRNYSEGTVEGQTNALKTFLGWAAERDLKRASQIPGPSWRASSAGSGAAPRPTDNALAGARNAPA